jgi:hypothetical protein
MMSEEFAGPNCRRQSVIYPDATQDHGRVVCHTCGTIENVQFIFGGRRYCWYDDGWQGSGWYWRGYRWRSGLGWGGGLSL